MYKDTVKRNKIKYIQLVGNLPRRQHQSRMPEDIRNGLGEKYEDVHQVAFLFGDSVCELENKTL